MPRRTESFASVTRHLATLLPPPEVPESVVSASGADSDRSAAPNGSTPETKRIDPSPVTYPGADQDYQIAARFAPVFHQVLGSSFRFDYITRVDFDGD